MTWLTNQWAGLSDADRATWIDSRNTNPLSPYHVFLKENVNRFKNLPGSMATPDTFPNWPTQAYPATQTGTICDWIGGPTTPGVGYFTHERTITAVNDNWGVAFFKIGANPDRPTYAKLIHIDSYNTLGKKTVRIENLAAGLTRIFYTRFTVQGGAPAFWNGFYVTIL